MASGLKGPEARVLQTCLLLELHWHTSLPSSVLPSTPSHVQHYLSHVLIIDIQRCQFFFLPFALTY